MAKRTCSIEDCERPFYGRDMCSMHYQRWYLHGTTDPTSARGMTLEEAVKFHVPLGSPDECWMTDVARDKNGYSRLVLGGKTYKLHRLAYEHFVGPIPGGLLILHTCDTPPCCNPAHLYPGTNSQNMSDKFTRDRGGKTLTRRDADEIRALYDTGRYLQREIGVVYGVAPNTVSAVVNNKAWTYR